MTDLTLTEPELFKLTGYQRPGDQIRELHAQGFTRARLNRAGEVIVERAHYDAVCRGTFANAAGVADTDVPRPRVQPHAQKRRTVSAAT